MDLNEALEKARELATRPSPPRGWANVGMRQLLVDLEGEALDMVQGYLREHGFSGEPFYVDLGWDTTGDGRVRLAFDPAGLRVYDYDPRKGTPMEVFTGKHCVFADIQVSTLPEAVKALVCEDDFGMLRELREAWNGEEDVEGQGRWNKAALYCLMESDMWTFLAKAWDPADYFVDGLDESLRNAILRDGVVEVAKAEVETGKKNGCVMKEEAVLHWLMREMNDAHSALVADLHGCGGFPRGVHVDALEYHFDRAWMGGDVDTVERFEWAIDEDESGLWRDLWAHLEAREAGP